MSQAYLLETQQGLVLVDAGAPGQQDKVLAAMRRLSRWDLRIIFITHAHLDHYGSAAAIRNTTGAKVAIHHADANIMAQGETDLGQPRGFGRVIAKLFPFLRSFIKPDPVLADILLEDGDDLSDFGLDARIVHTPGHTPGSASLLYKGRHAFVGDLISTAGKPHVQRNYATDWSQISSSLRNLASFRPEVVYPGHGSKALDGNVFLSMTEEYT
jgi:glyoxylase-like metal-dependent hydrolase (beta-lactamase superfamily II)